MAAIPTTIVEAPTVMVHLPNRGASRVDMMEANAAPRLQGTVVSPALRALKPRPTWTSRLKVKKNAGMPASRVREMSRPMRKEGIPKSESWTSGKALAGRDRS